MRIPPVLQYSILALIVVGLFWSAMGGRYELDDTVNLTRNTQVQLFFGDSDFLTRALNSGIASDLGRPVAMLSFALEHAFVGGFDPQISKTINLVIHLLNVLVLVFLTHALLTSLLREKVIDLELFEKLRSTTFIAAFIWAILPSNVSSVVYVIQRMNLLAVLFSLLALWLYFKQRGSPMHIAYRALVLTASLLCITFGVLSKENAVLVVVFIFGFEILAWYRKHLVEYRRIAAVVVSAILVLGVVGISWFAQTELANLYQSRPFDWVTRLSLQPLALLWYCASGFLPLVVSPRFFMDFLETSHYLSVPLDAWLALIAVLIVLLILLWLLVWRASILAYCTLGWFFVFHLIESTFWPLELGFLHRNYLPSIGLVWAGVFLVVLCLGKYAKRSGLILTGAAVYVIALGSATALESIKWGDTYTFLSSEAERNPVSTRAAYTLGNWMFDNDPADIFCEDMFEQFDKVLENSPNSYSGYYGYIVASERCGNRLDEEMLDEMEQLLVDQPLAASSYLFLDILSESCSNMVYFSCDQLNRLIQAVLSNTGITSRESVAYEMVLAKNNFYMGDYQAAVAAAQRILEAEPDHLQAHLVMMDVMYKTGNCDGIATASDVLGGQQLLYLIERDIQPLNERFPDCSNLVE